jgi:hypothetical protein
MIFDENHFNSPSDWVFYNFEKEDLVNSGDSAYRQYRL